MLITIAILAIVLLIATQTLNTIYRVSTISKLKTTTRNEIGFAIELVERMLANSNVVDVYVFNPPDGNPDNDVRYYDEDTEEIVMNPTITPEQLADAYNQELETGLVGKEVHIRPYGYSLWACIGYFRGYNDTSKGYLIRRTVQTLPDGHRSCFDSSVSPDFPILVLNSELVQVNDFQVSYIKSSDINNVFYIDLEMEPTLWVPGEVPSVQPSVLRQAIITTQGLTWY
jgi:hypothetical protein